jgi:hypothetical protein
MVEPAMSALKAATAKNPKRLDLRSIVAEVAFQGNLTRMKRPADLLKYVKFQMYDPAYVEYVPR